MAKKSTTSSTQQTIPQDVLDRYNSVNSQAQQAAATPFQTYSNDASAFVAPVNSTQQAGIDATNAASGSAQPYFDAATGQLINAQNTAGGYYGAATQALQNGQNLGTGLAGSSLNSLSNATTQAGGLQNAASQNYGTAYNNAQPFNTSANYNINQAQAGAQPYQGAATDLALAGSQAVDPSQLNAQSINQYLSPYLSTVLGSTAGLLNQQNQQAMAGQLGNAISSGAFGGDRAGIAAANLSQQQQLANANIFSGILNTGYNNALSTAQQQQGVNLSAQQANRSALSNASTQLQGLGQQGFDQGITTAQQQAALGNQEYNQGMGLGQAQSALGNQEYTQGAQTAAQQAALGQQLYAQGQGTSQGLGSLGQSIYNTGSATSQGLANLGTGSQAAALQGAQAQLAAGQVQQQTDQAGKTALYNQFLQQQSYPFQDAQFLANIAEGTGALSGQTSTTTQPGGFFSDERLKEDVKAIGKTYDGQTIYSYNYKGEPRTQIGLMAQDVEKAHPDAVGLAAGYKTVDYGKATKDAAKRGRFAYGGAPYDMSSILAAQQQMYGGLGGGGSRIPQANLPVQGLAPLPVQTASAPNALQQMTDIADLATKAAPEIQKGVNWAKKTFPKKGLSPSNDNFDADDVEEERYGGRVGLAAGGMPYDQGPMALNIPNQGPSAQLQPISSGAQKPDSGLDQLADIAKIAAAVATMKNGGSVADRPHKADGGGLSDFFSGLFGGNTQPASAPLPLKPPILSAPPPPVHHARPVPKSVGLRPRGPQVLADTDTSPLDAPLEAQPVSQPAGLMPADQMAAGVQAPVGDLQAAGQHLQGLGQNALTGVEGALDRYGQGLKQGDTQSWVPLLAGIAAMGTAPTRSLGVALASGLGAGTKSYMDTKKQLADLAQTKATTGLTQAQSQGTQFANLQSLQQVAGLRGMVPQEDAQGNFVAGGKRYSLVPASDMISDAATVEANNAPSTPYTGAAQPPVSPAIPQPSYQHLGAAGLAASQGDKNFVVQPEPMKQQSLEDFDKIQKTAQEAQASNLQTNRWVTANLANVGTGLQPGALSEFKGIALARWNDIANSVGLPGLAVNPEGLSDRQIADKIATGEASLKASGADQRSVGALKAFLNATPNQKMSPGAIAAMLADNYAAQARSIDQRDYVNEYAKSAAANHGVPGVFSTNNAETAFAHDHSTAEYQDLRNHVQEVLENPKIVAILNSGDQTKINKLYGSLDKHYGSAISRVFRGGQ